MKYWLKSCPPLVIRKTFVDSIPEMLEWMDKVIEQTKKDFKEIGEVFPPNAEFNIFERCFVLLKIGDKHESFVKKILSSDSSSVIKLKTMNENCPTLSAEWEKAEAIPKKKKGRKKKIRMVELANAI